MWPLIMPWNKKNIPGLHLHKHKTSSKVYYFQTTFHFSGSYLGEEPFPVDGYIYRAAVMKLVIFSHAAETKGTFSNVPRLPTFN